MNCRKQEFPVPIEKLIAKTLSKDQAKRWQTMSELEYELGSLRKVLDSPFHTLLQHVSFDHANMIKFNAWHGIALSAILLMSAVGLIWFLAVISAGIPREARSQWRGGFERAKTSRSK